jgi:hypothetical protein
VYKINKVYPPILRELVYIWNIISPRRSLLAKRHTEKKDAQMWIRNPLHEMRQSQSKPRLQKINEFQRSLENPKKVFQSTDQRIFLGPNIPNVRSLPRNTS